MAAEGQYLACPYHTSRGYSEKQQFTEQVFGLVKHVPSVLC